MDTDRSERAQAGGDVRYETHEPFEAVRVERGVSYLLYRRRGVATHAGQVGPGAYVWQEASMRSPDGSRPVLLFCPDAHSVRVLFDDDLDGDAAVRYLLEQLEVRHGGYEYGFDINGEYVERPAVRYPLRFSCDLPDQLLVRSYVPTREARRVEDIEVDHVSGHGDHTQLRSAW